MSNDRTLHPAVAWSLVAAQFVLLLLLGFLPWGSLWARGIDTLVVGLTLIALGAILAVMAGTGLGRALTPTPVPRAGAELTTTGMYGLVRHPLYTGLLLLGVGLVVIGASVLHVLAWVALLVLLAAKARVEEWMLLERYDEYAQYAARVGRLVPGIGRIRTTEA